VLLGHHRVVQLVVLVVEFDDRARQRLAFGQAQPLRQRARRDVAADHLERNDLHLLDQLLTQVEPLDEVVLHPMPFRRVITNSLMRLLMTPLPSSTAFLVASKRWCRP